MKCQKPRFFVRRSGAFDLVAIRDFGSEKRKKEKGEQIYLSHHRAGTGVGPVHLHCGRAAVRTVERYSTSCRAAKSSSPVRILTTRVTL